MPLRRALMASAAGVALVMLQALVLGNQWVVKWMFDHDFLEKSGIGSYVRGLMIFPHWRLTPTGGVKYMAVIDFTLLVLLVVLAALSTLGLMTLDPARSAPGALICGWWATLIAAAFTGFFSQVLAKLFLDVPPYFRLAASSGLEYGFAVGWVVGLAVMAGYVFTRPKPAPESA